MRKQLLGATALLLGATTLGFGVPAAPSHAVAWKNMTEIPFPAGAVSEVEVVSTGNGDAVAAAIIGGAVHAFTATDGAWSGHDVVRSAVGANRLVLTSDGAGEVAVGWVENVAGDDRLRVSRQLAADNWTGVGVVPMSPAGSDVNGMPDIGIDGSGRIIAVATVDGGDSDYELFATEWPKVGFPGAPDSISSSDSVSPSLDVNSKGEALVSFNYTGLINNVLTVVRRTPGKGWSVGDGTKNSGNIASPSDVAISENGSGQVVYSVVSNNFYRIETSRVLPTGVAMDAELVEVRNDFNSDPSVDINSSGTALFAWVSNKDGVKTVRYASALNGAYPGAAQDLDDTLADPQAPIARVGDGSLRMIQHTGNGRITTHQRTTVAQPFTHVTTGTGFGADASLDVDAQGNGVLVGFTAGGTFARFLDGSAPTVTMTKPGSSTTVGREIPLSWSASDSLGPLQDTSDVYLTTARWNQAAHTDPKVVIDNTPTMTATYDVLPGATYCFQARVNDTSNNGGNSEKKCTSVPLDDTSLAGSGWSRSAKTGVFENTWSTTSTKGRTLTRSGIHAKELALVASKTPTGGTVRVTWNGTTIRNISLKGTAANKVVLPIKTWAGMHTGTLKIIVTSESGRSVRIDGLVVTK
ncbi:hypothetical protein ASE01_10420 [Nocardioides sp. Root190]|uniref:hypothetical protein n=1 Tax=Nocardioides sp. Root190 TaxID=1736488 RepID=UPI0006F487A0|nr:hypothetical protein [Nocardioides sp. Root190]KRB77152.1 hypothetical protein ASE01_10420 [Nocardioides sp. Root190]